MNGPRIYNLFPTLVGPVARWSDHLDRIAAMHFDWIYLNPFTPPGGSGSLYAVSEYRALNASLRGEGETADDDRLRSFTRDAGARGIRVLVDLVVNHTADDASLTGEHPEWYRHEEDGSIAHPFVVDNDDPEKKTVWGDLAELDYTERPERDALVAFVTDVAKYYAALGFAGFRCDAAYKIPGDVWKRIIDAVRAEHPDALFVAETLGGPDDEIRQLGPAGFDYIFNSSKWWDFAAPWFLEQYEAFRTIAPSIGFPESHDTPRLASELEDGADVEREYRFRYLVAAALSSAIMMPIGYEYGFATALDVVKTSPEQWEEARFDLSDFIGAVNAMRSGAEPLNVEGPLTPIETDGDALVFVRAVEGANEHALIAINSSSESQAEVSLAGLAERGVGFVRDLTESVAGGIAGPDETLSIGPRDVRVFIVRFTPEATGASTDEESILANA